MALDEDDADLDREDDEEIPWLREMVEDDLLGLFGEEKSEISRTARIIIRRLPDDPDLQERLEQAFLTALRRGNDDTQATIWMALIFGETRDPANLPILFLGLGSEDESLQEACGDAILKIGPPGIERLLEEIDEEPGPAFLASAYRLLGSTGSLRDREILERTADFLLDHVDRELLKPPAESNLEALFHASALLGDRRMLERMDRALRERYRGRNPQIADSREMLAENRDGLPVIQDPPPWEEAHRWLFEEDPESSRVQRGGNRERGEPPEEEPREEEPREEEPREKEDEPWESGVAGLLWGLSATAERPGKQPIDARRFAQRPDLEDEDEDEEAGEGLEDSEAAEEGEEGEKEIDGPEESER